MKSAIKKLFQLRKALDGCERDLGLNNLSLTYIRMFIIQLYSRINHKNYNENGN